MTSFNTIGIHKFIYIVFIDSTWLHFLKQANVLYMVDWKQYY